VNREVHAPICGSPGARFPRATRLKAYRKKISGAPIPEDTPDTEKVKKLEGRVRELEMELAFLKKAAAYFAREQR
jgi:transposase